MHKRTLLAMAATALLAGCNFAPTYEAPATPIPDRFTRDSEPANASTVRRAGEISWQNFFGDPQLKFLIAQALDNNRDLAAATARVAQAQALYRIQGADRLPQLGVSGGASRNQAPLSALDPGIGGNASITYNQYNVQAALSAFEIDFWGRVRNLSESARRRYLATLEAERAFRLLLIGNVSATYYAIVAGREGIDLSQRTLDARRYGLEIAQLRLQAGVTSRADYEQSVILVTQAQGQLAELQRTVEQLGNRLMILVGGPIGEAMPTRRAIAHAGQVGEIAPGLPSELLTTRPDVLQAEHQLRAANADIGAARAAYFPRIALTGNFGYASTEFSELISSGRQMWSIGSAVSLPIFDAGRRSAQLAQTQARRDELVAAYQRTVQTAFSEVSDALVARRRYQEQIAAQEQAVAAQQRLAETAELRYQNGIAIYLEVMDAKRNLFMSEQQLIQLRAAALQNGVSLYVALGGGADAP